MPAASDMNERVAIQVLTTTPTQTGGAEETWNTVATVWCRTWGATGTERQMATMQQGKLRRHFLIRYYPGLSDMNRVFYRGETYKVTFADHRYPDDETYFDAYKLDQQQAQ